MLTIRIATIRDAEEIADLSRQTFLDTFSRHNTPANMNKFLREQFNREKLMQEVGAPGNHFLLAEDQSETLGYARLREDNNPPELAGRSTLEIARLYVVQPAIGRGIGARLMKASLELGLSLQKELAWLGVWEFNQHAIDFYERWGFKRFSQHPFRLGDDIQNDWLMKKDLEYAG